MKKVLIIDLSFPDYDELSNRLKETDTEIVFADCKEEDCLAEMCKDADVVVTTYTKITEKMIQNMSHCSMIIRTGIGVDNIDVEAATKKRIQVSYVPDYCRGEVADHTLAHILNTTRKLTFFNNHAKYDWNAKEKAGYIPRLQDCMLGIMGFGGIAQMVAKRAQGFDMSVCAYDPYLPDSVFEEMDVLRCATMDDVYRQADIISLNLPLTDETYHMINAESIAKMKENVFIVNTARGALVDEKALVEALRSNRVAGAGLDVFEEEPVSNPELYSLDNLTITPHVAFVSAAALPDLKNKVFDEIVRAINGEQLRNCINRTALNK